MKYHFEKSVACDLGVEEAILLANVEFWIEKNAANNKHFYDGAYWTYNSKKAFAKLFPFWSEKQVRRMLDKLIKRGYLKAGNYNQKNYDKTLWYTSARPEFLVYLKSLGPFGPIDAPVWEGREQNDTLGPNGPIERPKWADGVAQMGQPIPDNKPNIKTTVNRSKNPIHTLPLIDQPQEKAQYIAERILENLGDAKSKQFYFLVANHIPENVIKTNIAEILTDGAEHPAKLFTHRMMAYAKDKIGKPAGSGSLFSELQDKREQVASTMLA